SALEQLGVHVESVSGAPDLAKARRATYGSSLTTWDEATHDRVRKSMQDMYDLFLKRVAEGRGKPVEGIAPSAEGRIFSGAEAKERGLCDELGGLDDAIRAALELAKLPDDTPVELVAEHSTIFDIFAGAAGDDAETTLGEAAVSPIKAGL